MLTVFGIPKPFEGHIGVIQTNAIRSWKRLHPGIEIVLFGNEKGTSEMALEVGALHFPDVLQNEYGTPLVKDIFEKAEKAAGNKLLCYVNSDIMLMSDFLAAVKRVGLNSDKFLMVGQRYDTPIDRLWDFNDQWEDELREFARKQGNLHAPTGIDYFVFQRGLWKNIPDFAIGRFYWDGWLLYAARSSSSSYPPSRSSVREA